jgi:tRNA A-37 threonylcarbamoyl transferase component Bud32
MHAGSTLCEACESGTHSLAGAASCITVAVFIVPPLVIWAALVSFMIQRAMKVAKAAVPGGLRYPCPVLTAGIAVQGLAPEFAQAGSPIPNKYQIVEGELPAGLEMDAQTGVISGIPAVSGPGSAVLESRLHIKASNVKGSTEFVMVLKVETRAAPADLIYTPGSSIVVDVPVIFAPTLRLGIPPTHFRAPDLPLGLEINPLTGVISGAARDSAAQCSFVVAAFNEYGETSCRITLTIQEQRAPSGLHYADLAQDTVLFVGETSVYWPVFNLGLPVAAFSIDSRLPEGMAIDADNGAITGSPTQPMPRKAFTVSLQNSKGKCEFKFSVQVQLQYPPMYHVTKVPADAKRGDPANMSMIPVELRSDYEAVCVLGNGGHGAVLRASRVLKGHIQFQVAIKIIHSDRPFSEHDVKRINREATLLGRIDSPHVVNLKGSGISADGSIFWLVMDFLDGTNLQESIDAKGFIGEDEACDMCLQLLTGLEDVHRLGVVHCDVKPANVMRCPGAGSSIVYKLVDLGVAVAANMLSSLATMRNEHAFRGTPGFMCPEVIRDEGDSISPQADIWSLGATVFAALTGLLPFCTNIDDPSKPTLFELMMVATNLDEEPPDVSGFSHLPISAEFSAIVKTALKKRRPQRYPSVQAMKAAVTDHLNSLRSVPASWTPGGDRVALDPLHAEYGEAAALFLASLDERIPARIVRIERIQSRGQWGLYRAKRREMELRGGAGHGERRLFHGTDEATVPKIVSTAFNRSFCGKNATAYGQGVYFAADAEYSAGDTYSRPNARGEKRVFLCSVLVGACALGVSGMRVPPQRADGSRFDSTVDSEARPRIFVIYHDAQASYSPLALALALVLALALALALALPPSTPPVP